MPPAVTAVSEPDPANPSAVAAQDVSLSRPETAAQATNAQGRAKAQLTLAPSSTAAPRVAKAKTSGRISTGVWEEVRDCVVWHGHTMTLDSFTESAFREHLKWLRKQHGLGERFPAREHEPKHGRRVS
jgi:hypothetical protein